MAKKLLEHIRVNDATGEKEYYFPMEVENSMENQEYLDSMRALGYEVGWTLLGYELIHAVLIPCRMHIRDCCGRTIYVDTPEEEQRRIYNELIREALVEQKRKLHDGRCSFYKDGMRHRCPTFIPNPNFDPSRPPDSRKNPRTVLNRCDGCAFEQFKEAHDVLPFSVLEKEDENGGTIPFEGGESLDTYAFESFDGLATEAKAILHKYKPKLDGLVDLLAQEMTQADAARALGKRASTVNSRQKVLRKLKETIPELKVLFEHD